MIKAGPELHGAPMVSDNGNRPRDLMSAIAASRFNYYAAFVADLSCGLLFFYLGMRNPPSWPVIVIATIAGGLLFTLIEYSIHRWLLHTSGILTHLHDAHHAAPEGISAFLFPTSLVVLGLIWMICTLVFHSQSASFVISGVGFTYFYYGVIHHCEHRVNMNRIPFRWLKGQWAAHKVHHHFVDSNFGVITPFWTTSSAPTTPSSNANDSRSRPLSRPSRQADGVLAHKSDQPCRAVFQPGPPPPRNGHGRTAGRSWPPA